MCVSRCCKFSYLRKRERERGNREYLGFTLQLMSQKAATASTALGQDETTVNELVAFRDCLHGTRLKQVIKRAYLIYMYLENVEKKNFHSLMRNMTVHGGS